MLTSNFRTYEQKVLKIATSTSFVIKELWSKPRDVASHSPRPLKDSNKRWWRRGEIGSLTYYWWEGKCAAATGNSLIGPSKSKTQSHHSTQQVYTRELRNKDSKEKRTNLWQFSAAWVITDKRWKQPKRPSADAWITCGLCTLWNVPPQSKEWRTEISYNGDEMGERTTPSGRSQRQKDPFPRMPFTGNVPKRQKGRDRTWIWVGRSRERRLTTRLTTQEYGVSSGGGWKCSGIW